MSNVADYQQSLNTLSLLRGEVKQIAAGLIEAGEALANPIALMSPHDGKVAGSFGRVMGKQELEKLLTEYFRAILAARHAYDAIPEEERAVVIAPPSE